MEPSNVNHEANFIYIYLFIYKLLYLQLRLFLHYEVPELGKSNRNVYKLQ